MKQCNKCKKWKDFDEFRNQNATKDGKVSTCKECDKLARQERKKKEKKKVEEKKCSYCKKIKTPDHFNKDSSNLDGLQSNCIECNKEYQKSGYVEHREEHLENTSINYGENREHKLEKERKRHEDNKEIINGRKRRKGRTDPEYRRKKRSYSLQPLNGNSKSKFSKELPLYEEIRKSENEKIECKCAYCGDGFEPTYQQVSCRVRAINGEVNGEGTEYKLYCSDECKNNCPTYRKIGYEEGLKPATSREVQPALRKMVFARDDYTCQRCGYHRDELDVGIHCHHIDGIQWNPLESADEDACITLCEKCHDEAHDQTGCRYYELRCKT